MSNLQLKSVSKTRNYAIGFGLILVVVFMWTFANFLTQDLFEGGYDKPFFITYMNTNSFVFYLLPFAIRKLRFRRNDRDNNSTGTYQPLHQDSSRTVELAIEDELLNAPEPLITTHETAKLAFTFVFVWIMTNWTLNAALGYTSVASFTILHSTNGFFTMVLGRLYRVENLSIAKIGAVCTSFIGIIVVSLSDSKNHSTIDPNAGAGVGIPRAIFGDFLALLSAVCYSLFVILLKVRIQDESRIDMPLFLGFVGIFNLFCCGPVVFILHWTGIESFEIPSGQKVIAAILINMFIELSSDFLYVLAVLKTTPLVVTVGLSLNIPLAVAGDLYLGKPSKVQALFGAVLVLMAIGIIGVENSKGHEKLSEEGGIAITGQDALYVGEGSL